MCIKPNDNFWSIITSLFFYIYQIPLSYSASILQPMLYGFKPSKSPFINLFSIDVTSIFLWWTSVLVFQFYLGIFVKWLVLFALWCTHFGFLRGMEGTSVVEEGSESCCEDMLRVTSSSLGLFVVFWPLFGEFGVEERSCERVGWEQSRCLVIFVLFQLVLLSYWGVLSGVWWICVNGWVVGRWKILRSSIKSQFMPENDKVMNQVYQQ